MYKRILSILIVLAVSAIGICQEDAVYLNLREVSELALSNNFDIQLAQFDAQYEEADLYRALAIYDAVIEAEAKYTDDKTKTGSSLAGTASDTREVNLGISKKFETGTTAEVDFENTRGWSNSPFATINPAYDSSLKLKLTQELGKNLFGIKDRSDVRITEIDIENAHYTSLDKIEQKLADVHKTYWRVAKYLKSAAIRDDMLFKARELFDTNKDKIERGIIEKPQLLSSKANLKQKEIDLILAENDVEYYKNKLKLLLNLDDRDKAILPKDSLEVDVSPPELNKALRAAFGLHRDYLKAKNEIKSKRIKLVMKENNLWPEINLEGSITRNGLDDSFSQAAQEIFSEENPEYFLGVSVKFPIENREAKSEFDKTRVEKAKAIVNLKRIEREIFIEISDAVRDCKIFNERLKKQKNVLELQKEKLTAEVKRYKYGRSDTDTIIRYQDDLLASELLYTQAILEYREALIELALKESTLLDKYWL